MCFIVLCIVYDKHCGDERLSNIMNFGKESKKLIDASINQQSKRVICQFFFIIYIFMFIVVAKLLLIFYYLFCYLFCLIENIDKADVSCLCGSPLLIFKIIKTAHSQFSYFILFKFTYKFMLINSMFHG